MDPPDEELQGQIKKLRREIKNGTSNEEAEEVSLSSFQAAIPKQEFIDNVQRAKTYIEEGDIFQVVLSQRLKAQIQGEPFSLYRKLTKKSISVYVLF